MVFLESAGSAALPLVESEPSRTALGLLGGEGDVGRFKRPATDDCHVKPATTTFSKNH